jgi:F0F1-type ATP synthase assembly protein I
VTYAAGIRPHSVFAADLDGDGDLDLATANIVSDNISVLLNINAEPIPTLSEWGMIVLALLILSVGTVAVIRRRKALTVAE